MYLQLDGVEVLCADARQAPFRSDSSGRAFAGAWGARVFAAKRVWRMASVPLRLPDAGALEALLDGTVRTATGEFAPDASVQVRGQVERRTLDLLADGLNATVEFTVSEV